MTHSLSKISDHHRQRRACVYIRQSTTFQVIHNRESTERQYNLRQRAIDLGWNENLIDIIDNDQGQSAKSIEHREGFQKLASEIVAKQVGIVLMLEVSRLSRSCSDWHRLIEICSITRTLIADEAGIYDPREPNDRLLLGVKGTLSEAELFTLRTRLYEGRWNKAKKGQLGRSIPTGYIKDEKGNWTKDPNLQVQERMNYIFKLFAQLGIARRVLLVLKNENLKIPTKVWGGPQHGQLIWKEASLGSIMRLLKNPSYAGVYVYGACDYESNGYYAKTGKAKPKARPLKEWTVCLQDHHEQYISFDEYMSNQDRLHQNWFRSKTRGAPREGRALLQGIVWCGQCGSKMGINSYSAKERRNSYTCTKDYQNGAQHVCQTISARTIDGLIVSLFLEAMAPSQLEIAKKSIEKTQIEKQALKKQWEQQLTQARYDTQLAQRQYDAIDPDNRLVASELERRWNEKLEILQKLEENYEEANKQSRFSLTLEEIKEMEMLIKDLDKIWYAATTTDRERKQLIRCAIAEVQLNGITIPQKVEIRITWRSGAVSEHIVDRIKQGIWAPRTSDIVIERIRILSEKYTVNKIAKLLNQEGHRSAHNRLFKDYHILYIARRNSIHVTTHLKGIKNPNYRRKKLKD
ncbi:MAG TPA: recombinase family protein [Gammaproteobacteria bacterium]|nr:recombinase family protein [Gammaproteobacteria bacterium]HQZ87425.1 recombinase family protein [Gammaproteobacteria bacterium]HRA42583.1 recombinase family protein [Gammaproteobacteria bacterium]